MPTKRTLIGGGRGGRRYVRRNAKGQFKEVDEVGRSLSSDRRRRAKKTTTSGQGDRGDRRPRRAAGSAGTKARSKRQANGRKSSGRQPARARAAAASRARRPSTRQAQADALSMLKQQHREVEKLFAKMAKLGDGEMMDKRELFQEIDHKLTIHATIEERHFYPAVRAAKTEELVDESFHEHSTIKRQLAELRSLPHADRSFDSRIEKLKECVEHHAKEEEEGKLFPKVKRMLDGKQLEALAAQMRATMQRLESSPSRESAAESEATSRM
jgi:hemerythrin superfamily protein